MKLFTAIASTAVISTSLIGMGIPVFAGHSYTEKIDRFEGKRTAYYDPSLGSECILIAKLKGELFSCFFINSTESDAYPSMAFMKKSEGWDLLSYKNSTDDVPAILSYSNGVTKRIRLPVTLKTSTLYGGSVSETVNLRLGSIRSELPKIKKIEIRYGASEFAWILDQKLVNKVLNFVGN